MEVKTVKSPEGISGAAGLIVAIIARAVNDSVSRSCAYEDRVSAWAYLGGPLYCHHLDLLGLPPDTLPEVIFDMRADDVVEIFDHIRNEGDRYYETQEQIKRTRAGSRTNGRDAGQGKMAR